MPELLKDMKGKDIFRLVGDTEILDQFREILVESWYVKNLVAIGPHTKDIAKAIKEEKLDELKKIDPTIKNAKEIWEGVLPRLHITITGENSDIADNVQDLINLVQIEQDPDRIAWILDTLYKIRGIPVPPKREEAPAEAQLNSRNPQNAQREGQAQAQAQQGEQPVTQ
jgi:hypothetical protein